MSGRAFQVVAHAVQYVLVRACLGIFFGRVSRHAQHVLAVLVTPVLRFAAAGDGAERHRAAMFPWRQSSSHAAGQEESGVDAQWYRHAGQYVSMRWALDRRGVFELARVSVQAQHFLEPGALREQPMATTPCEHLCCSTARAASSAISGSPARPDFQLSGTLAIVQRAQCVWHCRQYVLVLVRDATVMGGRRESRQAQHVDWYL